MTSAPISLWQSTAEEPDLGAEFSPDGHHDVAVVGGGFTGLSTALHAAQKGLDVHVLEAEHVGFGGSGRNVGLVNAAAWLPPAKVMEKLGKTYGPRFIARFGDGPRQVFELIEKHQIRCEVTKTGTIHAAHSPKGFRELQARHADWQRLGEPVDLIGREEIAARIGSRAFHGGLLDHRAGTINPMAYCRGLARAALGAGARLSIGVRVTALNRDGGRWRITTDQGEITADKVVLGTNAYTDTLWPGLDKIFTPIHYLQVATPPMGAEAAHILPERQGLWDTGAIMFNYRRDAHDRLLVGTMGRVIGSKDHGVTRRWASKQIRRVFPELGEVTFEEAWHGRIAFTPDHLPRIHQLAEGLWTPIGYNGRGIGTGTVFGQAMATLLAGGDPADLPMAISTAQTVPRSGFRAWAYDLSFTANQIWRAL